MKHWVSLKTKIMVNIFISHTVSNVSCFYVDADEVAVGETIAVETEDILLNHAPIRELYNVLLFDFFIFYFIFKDETIQHLPVLLELIQDGTEEQDVEVNQVRPAIVEPPTEGIHLFSFLNIKGNISF
jgi:hypothetical protein